MSRTYGPAPPIRRWLLLTAAALMGLTVLLPGPGAIRAQAGEPTVTAVAIASDAGDDATYARDDVIRITVTFSEAVDVTGTPQLKIDMDPAGWGEKQAGYTSGSGGATLTFTHTVVEPNISTQGIAVLTNSLALNGGSIASAASQTAANLAHAGLAHNADHKVDWQLAAADPTPTPTPAATPEPTPAPTPPPAPAVSSVAITSGAGDDHTYARDEVIQVTLTFSEAVNVTGAPQLTIDMDPAEWGAKQAAYASGTGTATLVFAHTVVEPNISTQGIAVLANSLALSGGAIKSASSQTAANLSHSGLAHDSGHKVDWQLAQQATVPAVASVAITSDAGNDDTYGKDDVIKITVTFSEAVDVTGAPQLKIDMDPAAWGEKQAEYHEGTGSTALVFTYTVVEPNISTQGIAVLANSLALNGGTIKSASSQTAASLSHSGLTHDSGHKVDWQLSQPECALTAPFSVSALGVERAAVVTWTLPADMSDACEVTGFRIEASSTDGLLSYIDIIPDPSARTATLTGATPGEWDIAVYVTYGESESEPEYDYSINVPPNCAVTLTLNAVGARQVQGSWVNAASAFGCEAGGVYIDWKKSTDATWKSSFRVSNEKENFRNFLFGDMETVLYNFRVRTVDVRGLNVAEDDLQTAWIRTSPTVNVTPFAGPDTVTVSPTTAGGLSLSWNSYTGASSYVIRYRRVNDGNDVYSQEIASSESSYVWNLNLDNDIDYWVYVGAKVTHNGKTDMRWSVPTKVNASNLNQTGEEPLATWFIDDTPNANHVIGRVFMMADSNSGAASASCDINGGTINCPPRTLVSLDITRRGNYRMTITATAAGLAASSYPDASGYTDAGSMLDIEVSAVGNKGTGATATSSINASGAVSITLTNGGSGYEVTPDVEISAPPMGGTQATATATMSNGRVTGITVIQAGSGYTTAPTVTLVEKNGKLVIAWHEGLTENIRQDDTNGDGDVDDADEKRYFESYILQWKPSSVAGWDDFNARDHATAPFVINARAGVNEVELGGDARTYTVTGLPNGGYGVRMAPCTYVQGVQATATATISSGAVNAISVTRGGSRYSAAPNVTIDGSATGTAVLTNGVVTSVTIDSGGTGYTTAPTVTIDPPTKGDGCLVPTTENGVTTHADVKDSLRGVASGSHYITMDGSEVTVPGRVDSAGISSTATGKITAWYNQPEDTGGTRIHAYRFRLTPAGDTAVYEIVTPRVPAGIRSGRNSPEFTGLTSGVVYTVEIQAMNAVGAGPWTTVGTATPR